MTLTTHTIIGASVAQFFPQNPVIGLVAAIASHYVVDTIPHFNLGDCLKSLKREESGRKHSLTGFVFGWRLILDGFIVSADLFLGFMLALLFWHNSAGLLILLVGAFGGALPDLFQILYGLWRNNKTLAVLQKIHDFMHSPRRLDVKTIPFGILTEVAVITFTIIVCKLFS